MVAAHRRANQNIENARKRNIRARMKLLESIGRPPPRWHEGA